MTFGENFDSTGRATAPGERRIRQKRWGTESVRDLFVAPSEEQTGVHRQNNNKYSPHSTKLTYPFNQKEGGFFVAYASLCAWSCRYI